MNYRSKVEGQRSKVEKAISEKLRTESQRSKVEGQGSKVKAYKSQKDLGFSFKISKSQFTIHTYIALFILFCGTLNACTFLYIPPVLESQDLPEGLSLQGSRGLFVQGAELRLSVFLERVPKAGWLNVQWYNEFNIELASDSLWVSSDDEGFAFYYTLPKDTEPINNEPITGDWRAVVSFEDKLVRQFGLRLE